ncbi:MAG: elongation factor P hydroxylase [Halioglobus sp.]
MSVAATATACRNEPFLASRLEQAFERCFAAGWHTCLRGGADEPYYQPAQAPGECNMLYYRSDFFASALHEVAHWCIAGARRRQLADFGYWYVPGERTFEQQRAFEAVERKPQALECCFSHACGYPFRVSVDNLALDSAGLLDAQGFEREVLAQAHCYRTAGLPHRARIFHAALCQEFGTTSSPWRVDVSRTGPV